MVRSLIENLKELELGREELSYLLIGFMLLSTALIFTLQRPTKDSLTVRIEGDINYVGEKGMNFRPETIRVHHYSYEDDDDLIPKGDEIKEVPITWKNSSYGIYSGSVVLPHEMSLTVFPDYRKHNYRVLKAERGREAYNVDFVYNSPIQFYAYDPGSEYLQPDAKSQIEYLGRELRQFEMGDIGPSYPYYEKVKDYRKRAQSRYNSADNQLNLENTNESYKKAIQGTWFIVQARNLKDLSKAHRYIEKANLTIKNSYVFYTPPQEELKEVNDCLDRYRDYVAYSAEIDDIRVDSLGHAKHELNELDEENVDGFIHHCRDSFSRLEESYNYQKTLQSQRLGLAAIAILSSISVGILIGVSQKDRLYRTYDILEGSLSHQIEMDEKDDLELVRTSLLVLTALVAGAKYIGNKTNGVIILALITSIISMGVLNYGIWRNNEDLKRSGFFGGIILVFLVIVAGSYLYIISDPILIIAKTTVKLIDVPSLTIDGGSIINK